jgi:hypothetical protein
MPSILPSPLLRLALRIDAAGSAVAGSVQLAFTEALAQATHIPPVVLWGSGLFMLVYAATLAWLARAPQLWRGLVQFIALGNVGWTAGSLLMASGVGLAPSGLGAAYITAQALAVLGFAVLQFAGLRRSSHATAQAGGHASNPRPASK